MDELMYTKMHTCSRNNHLASNTTHKYRINGQGWLLQLMDGVNLLLWSKVIYNRYAKPIPRIPIQAVSWNQINGFSGVGNKFANKGVNVAEYECFVL